MIIREVLERKKSKNLRARMRTKVYNPSDAKIDLQAYKQKYEEQLKQERLDQRICKVAPQTPSSEISTNKPSPSVNSSPPVPLPSTTQTDPISPIKDNNDETPLNKIGTQHLT